MEKIVIATTDIKQVLYIIAKVAMNNDEIEIHYTTRYAPAVIYTLEILRKSFGWMETGREQVTVENTRCEFSKDGLCANPKIGPGVKCNEIMIKDCKYYKQANKGKFQVDAITIEKAGGIRGL